MKFLLVLLFPLFTNAAGVKKCDVLFEEVLSAREALESEGITGAMYSHLRSNLDDKEAKLIAEFGEYDYSRLGAKQIENTKPDPTGDEAVTPEALEPIFELDTEKISSRLSSFFSAAVTPNGQDLFFSAKTRSNKVNIYRVERGSQKYELFMEDADSPVFSADGKRLAVKHMGGGVGYYIFSGSDFSNSEPLVGFSHSSGEQLLFAPNSNDIMNSRISNSNKHQLWKDGKSSAISAIKIWPLMPEDLLHTTFSSDGKSILYSDNALRGIWKVDIKSKKRTLLYDRSDGEKYKLGQLKAGSAHFVSLSPDQKSLRFLTDNGQAQNIKLVTWDIEKKKLIDMETLATSEYEFIEGGFDPTGRFVSLVTRREVGSTAEFKFKMWRLKDMSEVSVPEEAYSLLSGNNARYFSGDGNYLIVSTLQKIRVYRFVDLENSGLLEEVVQ